MWDVNPGRGPSGWSRGRKRQSPRQCPGEPNSHAHLLSRAGGISYRSSLPRAERLQLQTFWFRSSGGCKSEVKVSAGWAPAVVWELESGPGLSPAPGALLARGFGSIACISAFIFHSALPVWVSAFEFPLPLRTPVILA